jgi:hypothetical protein
VAEILTICFVNIEFRESKKLIRPNIISHVPKLPESTRRKKQSLIRDHCSIVIVVETALRQFKK